jgi:hypothetical protein
METNITAVDKEFLKEEFKKFWDHAIWSFNFHKDRLPPDKIKKWVDSDFEDFMEIWFKKYYK